MKTKTNLFNKILVAIAFFIAMFVSTESYGAGVTITAPTLSISTAAFPSSYSALGDIVITETAKGDFALAANFTLILTAPTNFEFQAGAGSVTYVASKNITGASITVTSTTITVTYSSNGTNTIGDALTISGINVRATANGAGGSITRTGGTGTIVGDANGAVHSTLSMCSYPTTQATSLSFSSVLDNSMNINWTRGNGSNVIVVVKAGSAPTAPTDGLTYTANAAFGSGNPTASGSSVVYNGTGTTVNVTALSAGTTYYVAVYEYNVCSTNEYYMIPALSGSQLTTGCTPPSQATLFTSSVTTNSINAGWSRGGGNNVLVVARSGSAVNADPVSGTAYTANASFATGQQIGTGNYVVYNGSGSSVNVTGLTATTAYYFAIYEYNTTGNCYNLVELSGTATTATPGAYCAAANSNTNTSYYINSFTTTGGTANIANGSTGYTAPGYKDLTASVVTQQAGNSINFSLTPSSALYPIRIWVDWNADGDFDESNEMAYNTSSCSATQAGTITVPMTATVGTTRMRVRYASVTISATDYCTNLAWSETEDFSFTVTAPPAMAWVSCTATQSNTNSVAPSATNQQVIGIEVVTSGVSSPFAATSFTVTTTGSTSPVADIMANYGVKLYSTGTSSTFATTALFGQANAAATGTNIVITGNTTLSTGTNYFWLTYDVDCDATMNNKIDATCTNVTMNGAGGSRTPTTQDPGSGRTVANSVTVQIGTGTYTSSKLPIYEYDNFTYSQSIYTAAEIGGAGTISKLRFQYTGNAVWTDNNIDIYMGHTAKTTFSSTTDWISSGSMTMVGNAISITTTSPGVSWITITLTTPFAYNGTSNLVIGIDENTAGYHSSSDVFYATSCTGNKSIIYASDGTNPLPSGPPDASTGDGGINAYRPNIQLDITTVSAPPIMTLTSIVTTQYTADMHRGDATSGKEAMDERVIGIQITTANAVNPFSVTNFQVNMTGSTTIADFSKVKMYYTGNSDMFGIMSPFGTTVTAIPALGTTINFNGNQVLLPGTNYFWVTYDVKPTATLNDIADAQCTQVTLTGCPGIQTITGPIAGNRKIIDKPSSFSMTIGNNTAPNSAWGQTMIHDPADDTYLIGGKMANSNIPTVGSNYNFVVVKLKIDGTIVWSSDIGNTGYGACEKIIKTSDGGYLAVGETGADFTTTSAMAVKLTSTGTVSWIKTFENGGTEMAYSAIQNAAGDYVIVGQGIGAIQMLVWKLSQDGSTLQASKKIASTTIANDVIQTTDGGYAVGGTFGNDFCMVKLSSALATEGTLTWGGPNNDNIYEITENAQNDYTVFGNSYSYTDASGDFYAMRFTYNPGAKSPPVVLWTKTYGTVGKRDLCHGAAKTNDGGYILTGLTDAIGTSGDEVYVIKTDMNGDMKWGRSVGTGTGDDEGYATATPSSGDYIVGGLTNRPQPHYYLIKLDDEVGFCCGSTAAGGFQHNESAPTFDNTIKLTSDPNSPATTMAVGARANNRGLPTPFVLCNTVTTLPIELLSFTANCKKDKVSCKWTTASEINNNYFTIERSNDALHFESVATINGAGNSNSELNYEYVDSPLNIKSSNNYYRLKQTDYDGKFTYSEVVATICNNSNEMNCNVYPNPMNQTLTIDFNDEIKDGYSVEVKNCMGQVVLVQKIPVGIQKMQLSLADLIDGTYFISVMNQQNYFTSKIIKMN